MYLIGKNENGYLERLYQLSEDNYRNIPFQEDVKNIQVLHLMVGSDGMIYIEDAERLSKEISNLKEEKISNTSEGIIEEFRQDTKKIENTMMILQFQTMVLVALFIFMIATKMIAMEQSEISMMKSRGVSNRQIVLVYALQSLLITLAADASGLVLGCVLTQMIGLSNSFMEFVGRELLSIKMTSRVWIYLIAASIFGITVMTIPVIPRCKATIVEKNKKERDIKRFFGNGFISMLLDWW